MGVAATSELHAAGLGQGGARGDAPGAVGPSPLAKPGLLGLA